MNSDDRVQKHDQVEPTVPTWRFWLLTVLGFPVAGVAVLLAASTVRAASGPAALGLLAFEGWLLTRERTVRRMSKRRRALWVVIGCSTSAIIAAVGGGVLFFAALLDHCSDGC